MFPAASGSNVARKPKPQNPATPSRRAAQPSFVSVDMWTSIMVTRSVSKRTLASRCCTHLVGRHQTRARSHVERALWFVPNSASGRVQWLTHRGSVIESGGRDQTSAAPGDPSKKPSERQAERLELRMTAVEMALLGGATKVSGSERRLCVPPTGLKRNSQRKHGNRPRSAERPPPAAYFDRCAGHGAGRAPY